MKKPIIQFKLVVMLLLGLALCAQLKAAPVKGEIMSLRQPDGTYVKVKAWGDEFYHRYESLDGYTLVKDSTGWISYASLSADESKLISTGIIYTQEDFSSLSKKLPSAKIGKPLPKLEKGLKIKQEEIGKIRKKKKAIMADQQKSFSNSRLSAESAATTGSVNGVVILIDFPEERASISRYEIENLFNLIGYAGHGNNGSIRDYFLDVSGGQLDYTNQITQYYTASNPKSYYENLGDWQGALALVDEALNWLESTGFDFSTLTTENGIVQGLNFFYTGNGGGDLWPHAWSYYFEADGVRTSRYQITNIGTSPSIRTTCHEIGHMLLDWPDLYDTDYNSWGLGDFCLMAYGANDKNPVPPNPYLRMKAGWENTIALTSGTYTATSNAYSSYIFTNPNKPNEHFFVESRIQSGRNLYLPDNGLMIWHADDDGSNTSGEQMLPEAGGHFQVSLEQADGLFQLEGYSSAGDAGDLFKAGHNSIFNNNSLPDSKWWSGTSSGLNINSISSPGETMTFTVGSTSNTAPYVTLTAPANYSKYTAPASVTFTADASDADGTVSKVDFYYNGTNLIGTVTSSPYAVTWNNIPEGYHYINAVATDNDGAISASAPVRIIVSGNTVCIKDVAVPAASAWSLYNEWWDQNGGSTLSNESDALKLSHRAYGKNSMFVIETGETINIVSGETYNISFDYKDFAGYPVNSVKVGFASGVNWAGPQLTQPMVSVTGPFTSADFSTKSINLTATSTGAVHLVFELSWPQSPTLATANYFKNLSLCESPQAQSAKIEATARGNTNTEAISVNPNPVSDRLSLSDNFPDSDIHVKVLDLQGAEVYRTTVSSSASRDNIFLQMEALKPGFYQLVLSGDNYSRVAKFVKQ